MFVTLAEGTENSLINGGSFAIDSADDGLHTNSDMYITGGSFEIATAWTPTAASR